MHYPARHLPLRYRVTTQPGEKSGKTPANVTDVKFSSCKKTLTFDSGGTSPLKKSVSAATLKSALSGHTEEVQLRPGLLL